MMDKDRTADWDLFEQKYSYIMEVHVLNTAKARFLLVSVFIARGTSFLFSKTLMQSLSPMNILSARFLLAFAILALVFYKKLLNCDRKSLCGGIILGVLYTICMSFEMFGLRLIDSGVSSLIENMAIVLVPIFASILSRSLPKRKTMFCALMAIAGVGFLSLTQNGSVNGGLGIVLIILAAVTYAVCIMMTEKVSKNAEPLTIGIIQLGVMGILSFFAVLLIENLEVPQTSQQWYILLILVLLCSCFGFAFQLLGQKYISSEEAAVLTVINPFTASVMGIMVADESMTVYKLIGYVLVLAALVLYNMKPGRTRAS